ncbi:MAG: two-component sensor histidine kinase, partial [Acidimicrobiia bacterium]|nr:two-component sensor histidine kinase [Acidimicrobiia bacterium]
ITAERLGDRLPVDNPSNELGKLATVFNDTLGRLEASFDRMRQFTADVSHELRTPLTAIRSVGEVGLRTARDEATCRRVIGSMLEDVDRMTSLVERLLAWSRADTGQARLQIEVFDLGELADEVVGQVGVLAEEKRQSLGVEVAGDVRCAADRQVLRQALLNLIDNAIKYTPAGGAIRVRVTGAGGHVRLDVSDSGPGIAGDQKTRVFDRYFRSTQGSAQKGSGLGLAITKWAVEANGGDLAVASSEGNGSTFSITLPGPRAVVTTATERASA